MAKRTTKKKFTITARFDLWVEKTVEADSAPVCEACGGTGKAYLLHSRAERPCPMCQADQPPACATCNGKGYVPRNNPLHPFTDKRCPDCGGDQRTPP